MKEEEEEKSNKTVEVFSGSVWEAEVIKGLLNSHEIPCVIQDGILGAIAPYLDSETSVLVTEDRYEAAKTIIANRDKEKE